jgi:YbbR domain-containing protein
MIRFIKKLFLKNWGLKLVSLLLALIFWLTLIPKEKLFSEKNLTVSLELHNIPSEMELVKKPQPTIDVTIRAPDRLIDQISSATVHAVLDLQNANVLTEVYSLNKNMISIPEGGEVQDFSPSQVELKLERTKEITLDVEPVISGELREGLILESVRALPSKVRIKGPESKVRQDYKVKTSPIDISSLNQSTEIEADLILPDPNLRLASLETKVKIRILIQEEKLEVTDKRDSD